MQIIFLYLWSQTVIRDLYQKLANILSAEQLFVSKVIYADW